MALRPVIADLTQFRCDALILPKYQEQNTLPYFAQAMRTANHCGIGECIIAEPTSNCRTLIVMGAPEWCTENAEQTADCLRNSLDAAVHQKCRKIGVGLTGSGSACECDQTLTGAYVQAILEYPQLDALDVYLIVHRTQDTAGLRRKLDPFILSKLPTFPPLHATTTAPEKRAIGIFGRRKSAFRRTAALAECEEMCESAVSLDERLKHLDEGFTEMLLRLIDESGMKDSECYKKANVSRQLFSKIRSDLRYKPKKETVLAFALALELELEQTNALLKTAGYSLSHSNVFDIIIEYFISQRIYNVFIINEALYQYDQPMLGSE